MKVAVALALGVLLLPLGLSSEDTDAAAQAGTESAAVACPDGHLLVSRVRASPTSVAWDTVDGHEDFGDVADAMAQATSGTTVSIDMPTRRAHAIRDAVHDAMVEQGKERQGAAIALGDHVTFADNTYSFGILARCP